MTEVASLMTQKVVTIPGETPLPDAVIYLTKSGFSGLPVVDESGKLIGLFTERNLFSDPAYVHLRTLIKLFSEMEYYKKDNSFIKDQLKDIVKLKVKDLMNPNPPIIHPWSDIEDARQLFYDSSNNSIPVVDENNFLKGILSMSDLTKFYGVPIRKTFTEADVDRQIDHFVEQFEKKFIIVSRFRAKTWFIYGLILMVIGFVIAMLFILRISQK